MDIKPNLTLQEIFESDDFLILDTETSGIRPPLQALQIAIIEAKDGTVRLNSLVRPMVSIPAIATSIHGLTADTNAKAPTWAALRLEVHDILRDRTCVIYNANYDVMVLRQSDLLAGLASYDYGDLCRFECAMLWYADIWGEWDDFHGNNRWQKLERAIAQQGLKFPGMAHDALSDAMATRLLIRHIAQKASAKNEAQ
jgi:DNA polymerase-3 subunit epsilon